MSRAHDPNLGVRAWETLLRVHAALVPAIAGELQEATGVPLAWYDVLLELSREPSGALRMRELGERVVLSRSRVSRVVDEMVEAGLAIKQPDPIDGRAVVARLTSEGRSVFRRAAPVYLDAIASMFSERLSSAELSVLVDLKRLIPDIDAR